MGAKSVSSGRDGNGGVGRPGVQDAEIASGSRRGDGISEHEAVADGERGNFEIYTGETGLESAASIARDNDNQRSGDSGLDGLPVEPDAASILDEVTESGV